MDELTLGIMTKDEARQRWQEILPLVEHSLDYSPDIKLPGLEALVLNGRCTVVKVTRGTDPKLLGAVVVVNRPSRDGIIAYIMAIGGRWICTQEGVDKMKTLMKKMNAVKMAGIARPSIARMWNRLGITTKYSVMETDL